MRQRDEFLTEAMGECWHLHDCCPDKDYCGITYHCEKCNTDFYFSYDDKNIGMPYNDFTTWEGFGKLWEWSTKQEWWCVFNTKCKYILTWYINPERYAEALYQFLTEVKAHETSNQGNS